MDKVSGYWAELSNYWSRQADEFNKNVVEGDFRNQRVFELWKNLLRTAIGDKMPQHVLDVGAGSGFLSIALAEIGHRVSGVDIAPGMLEIATKNAAQRGLHIDFHPSDAADLARFPADNFDVVVSRYLVWTLPDPGRAYAEWWRVLRPGGKLIIIDGNWFLNLQSRFRRAWTVFAWSLIYLSEGRKPWKKRREEKVFLDLPFSRVWRPEEDTKILESCGYNVSSITPNVYPEIYQGIHGKFEYLKKCYWGPAFMIVAEKRSRGGAQ